MNKQDSSKGKRVPANDQKVTYKLNLVSIYGILLNVFILHITAHNKLKSQHIVCLVGNIS